MAMFKQFTLPSIFMGSRENLQIGIQNARNIRREEVLAKLKAKGDISILHEE